MKTIKAITLILLLTFQAITGQRIEHQQKAAIPFVILGSYFGFGIVHYRQMYNILKEINNGL